MICCNTAHSRSMCSMVRVWPQCWEVVGGPRDNIWDFVALVWPIRSRVITTSSALVSSWNFFFFVCVCVCVCVGGGGGGGGGVLVLVPIWFEPPVWCRNLLVVSNLHSEQLSAGLCHGQGPPSLAGPLSHYPQCHNGLAPSRSGHMCLCHSEPRERSWYDKWEGFPYLRPQLPASKTLTPSRKQHRAIQDPCAYNSPVPGQWL